MSFPQIFFSALLLTLLSACELAGTTESTTMALGATQTTMDANPSLFSGQLPKYWYEGKAEISVYDLQQSRYGQPRRGQAVLIQVSEDFLTDEQVKNDNYRNPNSTPIIKTNLIKRFTTGLYDYSIMTSVFTPTKTQEYPRSQKVTMSSQDWCGQTFGQLNATDGEAYRLQWRSYFENEGDQDLQLNTGWLEDELMNRLRIDPEGVPTGRQRIVPALDYLALMHRPLEAMDANCSRTAYAGDEFKGADLMEYRIEYPELQRELRVIYEAAAPYTIAGWREQSTRGGQEMVTTARLSERVREPYWQQNGNQFLPARAELNLPDFGN